MGALASRVVTSEFGKLAIVWQSTEKGPRIRRILLPNEIVGTRRVVRTRLRGLGSLPIHTSPVIEKTARNLEHFLRGDAVDFDLSLIAFEDCRWFQRRVLMAEYGIPRGYVSTYGRIARKLGVPRGARAVGTALGRNPFPIVIPCHRAVRQDGSLGGFRGGLKMKRAFLEMEGREFFRNGKLVMTKVHY